MPVPKVKQLDLSEADRQRLVLTIEQDYSQDSADLEARNQALVRWYKLWRAAQDPNAVPEQERSSFSIPLVLWNILAKLAKELDILLGEESEIAVVPIGDSDVTRLPKVKKWINWRIKNSLKLFTKFYVHLLQKNIFGTSIAYLAWATRTRKVKQMVSQTSTIFNEVPDPVTGLPALVPQQITEMVEDEKVVTDFDGPDFQVENLEDWIFPAHSRPFQPLNHFIRRLRLSIEQVLDMRDEGKLDEAVVSENLDKLRRQAKEGANPAQDSAGTEQVSAEKNAQHGLPDVPQGRQDELFIHNWFGKFRLNVGDDGTGGEERAEDVVAFFQPQTKLLLGTARLVDIFPDGRNPFVVSRGILDVNRWEGIGMAEVLEPISQELDAFHKLAVSAGEGAIGPVILGTPGAGLNLDKFRLEPFTFVPVADANNTKVVNLGQINLAPYVLFTQQLFGMGEKLTGLTDAQLGRTSDRPNAPRTLGQQQLFDSASNIRLMLDVRLERESMREVVQRCWEMDKRWLPKPFFFRVTEQDPGDVLTEEDMMGDYDFDIGPVTALSNRAQKMQETLQALALLQASNVPAAYYALLKKVVSKLGAPDAAELIPDMEQMRPPDSWQQENVRILQGEDVDPHPMDNHIQHIQGHDDLANRLEQTEKVTPGFLVAVGGTDVIARLRAHSAEHQQAMKSGAVAMMGPQGGGPPAPGNGGGGGLASLLQGGGQPGAQQQNAQGLLAGLLNQGNMNLA